MKIEIPKYDCGVSPYNTTGGFKAWVRRPNDKSLRYLTTSRGGVQSVIRYPENGTAWRNAKDRMKKEMHDDVMKSLTEDTLVFKRPSAYQLAQQAFKDGSATVETKIKRKKVLFKK